MMMALMMVMTIMVMMTIMMMMVFASILIWRQDMSRLVLLTRPKVFNKFKLTLIKMIVTMTMIMMIPILIWRRDMGRLLLTGPWSLANSRPWLRGEFLLITIAMNLHLHASEHAVFAMLMITITISGHKTSHRKKAIYELIHHWCWPNWWVAFEISK